MIVVDHLCPWLVCSYNDDHSSLGAVPPPSKRDLSRMVRHWDPTRLESEAALAWGRHTFAGRRNSPWGSLVGPLSVSLFEEGFGALVVLVGRSRPNRRLARRRSQVTGRLPYVLLLGGAPSGQM